MCRHGKGCNICQTYNLQDACLWTYVFELYPTLCRWARGSNTLKLTMHVRELHSQQAIQDQNFAFLYADMCKQLESQSTEWAFLQVGFMKQANQWFWIKDDLDFVNALAGPYTSERECINAVLGKAISLFFKIMCMSKYICPSTNVYLYTYNRRNSSPNPSCRQ